MKIGHTAVTACLLVSCLAAMLHGSVAAQESSSSTATQTTTPAADSGPADWPRQFDSASSRFTIYQPQLDFWNGHSLTARAAVAVKEASASKQIFGTIWIEGQTSVDKASRIVTVDQVTVSKTSLE